MQGSPRASSDPAQERPASERLTLSGTGRSEVLEDFARDVRAGLGASPKTLPCAWLYDRQGSLLFERICELPEYYLTRAELEILRRRAAEIAGALPPRGMLVELGSGSAAKTRVLIEELLRREGRLDYVPIDISRTMLEASARALLAEYPALRIHGVAAEYQAGLHELRSTLEGPRLVLWLGSNIGNFPRGEAVVFLRGLRADLGPQDRMLVGADLRKDRATLERAYDDPAGVTASFNLNLLARINRELGGEFDPASFRHVARWVPERDRMEMFLRSLRDQTVRIRALDLEVPFEEGEEIHTENSHKYSPRQLDELAAEAGFAVERRWLDARERFSLNLLRPLPE